MGEPFGWVRGEVLTWTGGRPVAGATVSLPGSGMRATSARDGTFLFPRPLRAAWPFRPISAVVSAPGFGRWTIHGAPLYPGDTLLLHVELRRQPTVHRVLGPRERRTGERSSAPRSTYSFTCSGWPENLVPPSTIKVWITKQSVSKRYGFLFYVAHVLPNEWIPSWDADALGAGAIAVKNYGWYRTQPNHAFSGGAACADVTDSPADQVFDPTWSTASTNQAVNATFGSVLRRKGAIFLAHYFAGAPGDPCAAAGGEHAGWMSQWGTQTCATQGKVWPDITTTFYVGAGFSYLRNLLLNGTLQTDDMYPWLTLPGTQAAYTSGTGYDGSAYLTFTPPDGGGNGTLYQTRPFLGKAGSRYHEEIALRCGQDQPTSCAVILRLIAMPASGSYWVERYPITVPKDGVWHLYGHDTPSVTVGHVWVQISVISHFVLGIDAAVLSGPFGGP
jgi:Stage II sporulation protein